MTDFFIVRPEVPGGLGAGTRIDRSTTPIRVTHLEYEFAGWLGDELFTSFPAFAVTESLGARIRGAGLTGIDLRPMVVTRGDMFLERYPGRELPAFDELLVDGKPGLDDFGIDADNELVVSQRALDLINETGPLDLDVEPITS